MADHRPSNARSSDASELPTLSISAEKVYWVATNARRFDVKDVVTEPDPGSNPSDDAMREIMPTIRSSPSWSRTSAP
jgi:hypothetical protein